VGGDVQLLRRLRVAGETRGNAGADRSRSWTFSGDAYGLSPRQVSLRARVSQFDGSTVRSRLSSGSLGFAPFGQAHVEISGGVRRTLVQPAVTEDVDRWQSADVDLPLGRRWYVNGGWERDYGGLGGETRQLQAGLDWRF